MYTQRIRPGVGRRFQSAFCLAAFPLLLVSQAARGEPAPEVADVRAEWQVRFEQTPDTNTIRYDVHSFPTYILVDQAGRRSLCRQPQRRIAAFVGR